MIRTPELIEVLAGELKPVRRLRPPAFRASCWLMVGGAVVALLVVGQGLRADLPALLGQTSFSVVLAATLATAICAALAAFNVAVPGRSRLWALLPVPPLVLWIASIGNQCLTHWVRYDAGGMAVGDTARCFATLALTSLPLMLLMLLMLRRTGPVRQVGPILAGGLAVASMAATAMNLVHQLDASAMILLWNFGTGAVVVIASALFSRQSLARSSSLHG
jgi:hypothetical protein